MLELIDKKALRFLCDKWTVELAEREALLKPDAEGREAFLEGLAVARFMLSDFKHLAYLKPAAYIRDNKKLQKLFDELRFDELHNDKEEK